MKTALKIGKEQLLAASIEIAKTQGELADYNQAALALGIPCCQVNNLLGSLTENDEDALVVDKLTKFPNGGFWNATPERKKYKTLEQREAYHRRLVKILCAKYAIKLKPKKLEVEVIEKLQHRNLISKEDFLAKHPNTSLKFTGIRYTQAVGAAR